MGFVSGAYVGRKCSRKRGWAASQRSTSGHLWNFALSLHLVADVAIERWSRSDDGSAEGNLDAGDFVVQSAV